VYEQLEKDQEKGLAPGETSPECRLSLRVLCETERKLEDVRICWQSLSLSNYWCYTGCGGGSSWHGSWHYAVETVVGRQKEKLGGLAAQKRRRLLPLRRLGITPRQSICSSKRLGLHMNTLFPLNMLFPLNILLHPCSLEPPLRFKQPSPPDHPPPLERLSPFEHLFPLEHPLSP
jgi:hypothetical protein